MGDAGRDPEKVPSLLQTFADQAVIAIENVRLFNETKDALARQTASADILGVISSSPTDVRPVYEAIVRTAQRLLACDGVIILHTDGRTFAPVAGVGPDGRPMELMDPDGLPVDPDANFPSRVIVGKTLLHLPDWDAIDLPAHEQRIYERRGIRCVAHAAAAARRRVHRCAGARAQPDGRLQRRGDRAGEVLRRPGA